MPFYGHCLNAGSLSHPNQALALAISAPYQIANEVALWPRECSFTDGVEMGRTNGPGRLWLRVC